MLRRQKSWKDRYLDRPVDVARQRFSHVRERIDDLPPVRRARRRRRVKRAAGVATAAAAGATAAYFLDPQLGRTRRVRTKDRVTGAARRAGRRAGRVRTRMESDLRGRVERIRESEDSPAPNDVTLAHRVESELLGRGDVEKGSVLIDAANGVVALRGQVSDSGLIADLVKQAERIPGVRAVDNLLHLPGEPAPNKRSALRAGGAG